jgi:hypothetical protein
MTRLLLSVLVVLLSTQEIFAQSRGQAARILARTGRLPEPIYVRIEPSRPASYIKMPSEVPPHLMARRQELKARKEAQRQRMYEFQAARAELEERRYQDWHQRYLADTPVREEYYRALANAYTTERALAYERAAYANLEASTLWYGGPPIYYPPIYWSPGVFYFVW